MPAASSTLRNSLFLCVTALVTLWLLGFFPTGAMAQIPYSFTIEIDGKSIAKVDKSAEDLTEVKLGDDAAIFDLKNGQLRCGEWVAARDWTENRSFGPKKVSWYKATFENEKRIQPVIAKKKGETYELVFTSMFQLRVSSTNNFQRLLIIS